MSVRITYAAVFLSCQAEEKFEPGHGKRFSILVQLWRNMAAVLRELSRDQRRLVDTAGAPSVTEKSPTGVLDLVRRACLTKEKKEIERKCTRLWQVAMLCRVPLVNDRDPARYFLLR